MYSEFLRGLEFEKQDKFLPFGDAESGRFQRAIAQLPRPIFGDDIVVGIDPGRNIGLCTIFPREIQIVWGHTPKIDEGDRKRPHLHGLYARNFIQVYLNSFVPSGYDGLVIEGPAYRSKFGDNLTYLRMGLFLGVYDWCDIGMMEMGTPPPMINDIYAPASIRKRAFGNGKEDGTLILPTVNHNAVASIGCALMAGDVVSKIEIPPR